MTARPTSEVPELLPCPFCGGEAELMIGYHANTDAKVGCVACSSEGPLFGSEDMDGGDYSEKAVTEWNCRVQKVTALLPANLTTGDLQYVVGYNDALTLCRQIVNDANALAQRGSEGAWRPIESAPNGVGIIVCYAVGTKGKMRIEAVSADENDYAWKADTGERMAGLSVPILWHPFPPSPQWRRE